MWMVANALVAAMALVILLTAGRTIRQHFEMMAMDATVLAGKYAGYLLDASHEGRRPSPNWKDLADFLAADLDVQNAVILDNSGRVLAAANPQRWVDSTLTPDAALSAVQTLQRESASRTVMAWERGAMGVLTRISTSDGQGTNYLYLEHDMSEAHHLERRTIQAVALAALVAAFITTIASWWLSKSFSRPLESLSQSVRAYGEGQFDHRVSMAGSTEFKTLAGSFNEMASALQRHMAELERETRWRTHIESELRIASELQNALLPRAVPVLRNVELETFSAPAREVGGDFHDLFALGPNQLGMAIGDATGKGLPAALLITECSSILRALADPALPPHQLLARANRILCSRSGATHHFVTLFLACLDLDSGLLRYSVAGHNPPLLIQGQGNEQGILLESKQGLPLGIEDEVVFGDHTIQLAPGDLLGLYTDGLTEARNSAAVLFGVDRLARLLSRQRNAPLGSLLESVREEVFRHNGDGPLDDDITIVLARFTAPGSGKC